MELTCMSDPLHHRFGMESVFQLYAKPRRSLFVYLSLHSIRRPRITKTLLAIALIVVGTRVGTQDAS